MKNLIKVFKSKWWDFVPVPAFLAIAVLEGSGYWIGGIMTIVWLFSMVMRHMVK